MLDIKFVRENPAARRGTERKKDRGARRPVVDETVDGDAWLGAAKTEANELGA